MALTRYFQKIILAIGRRFKILSWRGVRKHYEAIHSLLEMDCFATKWLAMTKNKQWIATSQLVLLLTMTLTPVQAAWFNGDWSSREKITIKVSQVNGDLSEFPVYLNLADLPDAFFTSVIGTGADIRITLADEVTETSFELVEIDTANGTGELWFKAPLLSSTTDSNFYIYYGNPTATAYTDTDPYGTHNVWSNGFVAVYHMNENPAGTIKDSTQYNNDGVSSGVMTSGDLVKGQLSKAINFDGINDYLNTSLDPLNEVGTNMTVSGWAYSKASNNYRGIAGAHISSFQGFVFGQHESGNLHFGFGNAASWGHGVYTTENLNSWSSYTMLINTGLGIELFKDGISAGTDYDGATISNISDFWIGRAYNAADRYFNGNIDELRVSNNLRLANWVSTEYKNQNSPGNFYLIENGNIAGFNPTLWSNKLKITIPASVINGDIENFPVYVDLADLPLNFFGTIQASGVDIRITKADQETQLAFELVEINTINKTGELWFKADTLSSTQDNVFYLWFGNPQAQAYSRSDEFGSENVWTEGYVGVWHMNEDPSQGQVLDSTSYKNHGDSLGSMTDSDLVSSQLGKSLDFDGNDGISIADNPSLDLGTNNLTVSAWLKNKNNAAAYQTILVKSLGLRSYSLAINSGGSLSNLWSQGISSASITNMSQAIMQNQWEYLVMTRDTTVANTYIDNNSVATLPRGARSNTNDNLEIATGGLGFQFFTGELDEIRLSNSARTVNWIKTEYLNQKDTGAFYTIDNGDLNNTAWSNLYKITVLASQVNGDLTDFPVYVNLAHLPSDFFNVVNGSGTDIRITTADRKTQTAFELVSLDTANGQGELWFKAPFLSGTTDTDFYLLAGNPNVEAYAEDHIFGAQNVWSNGFVAVYHMNEDPSTGSGAIKDSTKYNNDGTSNGAMTNGDLVIGQLGKAIDFDGSNDKVTINKGSLLASQFSLALWISPTLLSPNDNFVGVWNSSGWLFRTSATTTASALEFFDGASNFTSASSTLTTNTWQYLHTKMNSSSYQVFKDGSIVAGPVTGLATPTPNSVTTIGSLVNTSYAFPGKIDNVSFSNRARSTNWIKTEYNNQNSSSTFYTTEKVNRSNAVMFGRMF